VTGKILAEGAVFQIRREGTVAVCEMKNAESVPPEEGARCAQLIRTTLTGDVITANSDYSAVLFDVRLGPPAFGPKTRLELATVFQRAGELGFTVGVLTSSSATQRLQFGNLCQEFASTVSLVGSDVDQLETFCSKT
jgi:hypothetical protein